MCPHWIEAVRLLLNELLLGPPDPQKTWVVSNELTAGLIGTLDGLSANQASAAPAGRKSIAAHAEHVRVGLTIALAHLNNQTPPSWENSWSLQTVNEPQWRSLRDSLRALAAEVDTVLSTEGQEPAADTVTGVIATAAHVAYHLGAVRQLILK